MIVAADAELLDDETRAELARRPRTRGECINGPRPCPWVGCRHHLALEVNPRTGHIKVVFDDISDMVETCSLDVASRGGEMNLSEIGKLTKLTRERIRQIEGYGLRILRFNSQLRRLR